MRQPMHETLYETADVEDTLSDSVCRRHSMEQQIQETLFETADAGNTL